VKPLLVATAAEGVVVLGIFAMVFFWLMGH
jgi:hypothetical protein